MRKSQEEREQLLNHAIDASNIERRRIARDLHDGVVQDLAAVSYSLSAAAEGAPAPFDAELREAAAETRHGIGQLRTLLVEIYPPELHRAGLAAALADLLAGCEARGIKTHLDVDPEVELGPASEALFFRVAQEALRNVVKHAGATNVELKVGRANGRVQLLVADDGSGFDQAQGDGHFGLTDPRGPGSGIRWRARDRVDAGNGLACLRRGGRMIRVLLAEDHSLVRAGLEKLLGTAKDIEVVGGAADGAEAIELAAETRPDVVLMDLSMPNVDGIEATRAIVAANEDVQVVVLTSLSDRDRILAALDAGAIGYLLKDAEPAELIGGVRAAARGESPLSPKAARALLTARAERESAGLSEREREVCAASPKACRTS